MTTRKLSDVPRFANAIAKTFVGTLCAFGFANFAFAAGLPGKYVSDTKCALTVELLDMRKGMTEGWYKVDSTGDGTCTWSGLGVAQRTHLDAGAVVSLSATLAFADLNWLFGPGGDQVEITFFDNTGKLINKQLYKRVN